MLILQRFLLLALAGALGTLSRYGVGSVVQRYNNASFPWGTLAVNVIGCFLAGTLWTVFKGRWPVSAETQTLVLVGFLGAFTTFASFILDTGELCGASQWMHAVINAVLHNGLGFAALLCGIGIGRIL